MHHIKAKIFKAIGKKRDGRGFSREELKKAGLNLMDAASLELPVDRRRKTAHEENIESIKVFVAKAEAASKPKPVPKAEAKKKSKS